MDSDEVRHHWESRSGAYSPEYYAYRGPDDASEAVLALLERHLGPDPSVLELGCSSGRHLAHLRDEGVEDLSGVEVNPDAFDVMAEAYPDLADAGTFYEAAIEDVVEAFADGQFDLVYSVETLQHLHPDLEWVLDELVRITDGLLVTVESEPEAEEGDGGRERDPAAGDVPDHVDVRYVDDEFPLYYRDWNEAFTGRGLRELESGTTKRDTVRAFRAP